jgi:hypothetical protein
MTTMRETAINRPLTGLECRELLRRDFEKLLANEGSLSNHIAYARVGWQIILRLHTANPMMPGTEIEIKSRSASTQERAESPALAAIETPPLRDLVDADEASIGGMTLQRSIQSPNVERVREGLPIPVEVRQQDGTKTVEEIVYPKQPDAGDGEVTIADTTGDARAAFGR